MHGPTCIFWANLTSFLLRVLALLRAEPARWMFQGTVGSRRRRRRAVRVLPVDRALPAAVTVATGDTVIRRCHWLPLTIIP